MRVSIVIPTLDGGGVLRQALDAIASQRTRHEVELVAVDSGSTDGTRSLLAERADRVLDVPRESFDHGLTRNAGIGASRGEAAVLLVQDAVPAGPEWLDALVRPLEDDARVGGAFARQIARPEASALTRRALSTWVAASEVPRVVEPLDRAALAELRPVERHARCAFDNVCSCLRRSVWKELPFRSARIAEDLAWGREALLAGHRIAYAPEAAVVHSHERSVRYELGRTYLVHQRLSELFGMRTVPSLGGLARAIAASLAAHARCLGRAHGLRVPPREAARAVGLALAWPLGQFLGGRAHATGRTLLRPRGI